MDSSWTGRTADWVRPPIAVVSRLASELRAQGRDLVDLGQAILGLAPPAAAMQGVRDYLEEPGPHVYSPDPGLPALRDAIAGSLVRHKHIPGARGDRVMVTCGANQAFANALLTVTRPGDEVITFDPGYFDHGYTIRMAGCTEVPVALPVRDDRYTFDLDAVSAAITPRTRAVVLVSPGNPTGAVASRPFVEGLCELCRSRGVWVLSDETYDRLTFPPAQHCSPASVAPDDRVIVLGSFSKILGLAGWRVGYLYGSDRVIEEAYKVQDALVVCAPVASQRAVLATLDHLDAYVTEALEELERRRDTLLSCLDGWRAVRPRVPDGATFLLARIEGQGDDVSFCRRLLEEAGVVTVPGSAFGAQGKGTIRLSFGNQSCERIREAGERMRGVV